jgi:hypothetical protein
MAKFKLSALISVLVVFLSGALVGAVAQRLYMVTSVSSNAAGNPSASVRKQSPEDVRKHAIDEMRQRVKLDETQVKQLEEIYDKTRQRFDRLFLNRNAEARALWDEQNDEIRHILHPDQLPLFEQLHAEHEARRLQRKKAEDSK